MKKEIKQKWVEALRNGGYPQGRTWLQSKNGYCCLGVLCNIAGCKWEKNDVVKGLTAVYADDRNLSRLPHTLSKEINLSPSVENILMYMNDSAGKTFNQIADYIEQNIGED